MPAITISGWDALLSYTEQNSASVIDSAVTINNTWVASASNTYLSVNIASPHASDVLSIKSALAPTKNTIYVSASDVTYTPNSGTSTLIGTIDGTLNGTSGSALKINLNASATATAVELLAEAIQFANTSDNPPSGSRAITLTIVDGTPATATSSTATVTITPVNDIPTLTSFATVVDTVNQNTEVEITFAELTAQGNEADADGTVDAFVVQAVSSGTLKIGTNAGSATAYAAGTNDTISSTLKAYWTPASNANGTLNAFTVKAKV